MSAKSDLIAKLQEIFQTDRADLDFGIYRILNTRRDEINGYLKNTLPAQIKEALAGNDVQEAAVYNHLLTFFSRYYEEGDFISQRRYKGNTYAIPYNGEEVLLHWANKDQYYTKSGENFSNYRFTLAGEKQVFFKLVAADTAKDNQKDNDKSRLFVLADPRDAEYDDDGEELRAAVVPISASADGKTLTICFEYKTLPKGEKQKAHSDAAIAAIREHSTVQADWSALFALAPTKKDPKRTVLEKHLTDYTAKNSADYFIHKDLGGFLKRELDFYIKNEVMDLDNIQHEGSIECIADNLKLIQTLRAIAQKIIAFLAQLENFQKKLWLKKKFVVGHHYLITLNHILKLDNAAAWLTEIFANEKQRRAWQDLFAFNQLPLPPDLISLAESNCYLILDTSLFPPEFQTRLLSALSIEQSLDTATDGILIHSDNFQALNLLQARYREQVKCIYIDPPYNTEEDRTKGKFIYKDGFPSSSWATLIENRLNLSYQLLKPNGVFFSSLDNNELASLDFIFRSVFRLENFQGLISWRRRHNQPNDKTKMIGLVSEYILSYSKNKEILKTSGVGKVGLTGKFSNSDNDPKGAWGSKPWKAGSDQSGSKYTIISPTGKIFNEEWLGDEKTYQGYLKEGRIYFPNNGNGSPRKKYYYFERQEEGQCATNWWSHEQFGHNQGANDILTGLFGIKNVFSNPKPIELLTGIIHVSTTTSDVTILDYFAGSGTTAHAVINLNREDGGKRKYILVEQGEYFDTVLKPRVQKVVYSKDWKDGKPIADKESGSLNGVSQMVKVLKLESYEDTLNNLQLRRFADLLSGSLQESVQQDYLLHYMLDLESRDSLLSTDVFKKPFDYRLNIATDSAGESVAGGVDLVETFNYLLGLRVQSVEDKRFTEGYVFVEGYLKNPNETILLVWRDCEVWDYDKLPELLKKKRINPQDSEYETVYINGDHTLPTAWQSDDGTENRSLKIVQIEAEFLRLMFAEA